MFEDGPRCSSEEEDDVVSPKAPMPVSPGLRTQILKCVNTLSGHHSGIRVIAVATNSVYTGSYDNTIKVWNLDNGRCEATLEGHSRYVCAFAVLDAGRLASGSADNMIKLWSANGKGKGKGKGKSTM